MFKLVECYLINLFASIEKDIYQPDPVLSWKLLKGKSMQLLFYPFFIIDSISFVIKIFKCNDY